jgi:hypothetical protein
MGRVSTMCHKDHFACLKCYFSAFGCVCVEVSPRTACLCQKSLHYCCFNGPSNYLVRTMSGSTTGSCAAVCSNLRVATPASCNIYYVVNGICKTGVLDNPLMYAKPAGSSASLLQVMVLQGVKSGSLGSLVKPGNC